MVSPAGVIAGPGFNAALNALRAIQTFDDMKRGTMDAMAYLTGFGLTTSVDMGAFTIPRYARHAGRRSRRKRRKPESVDHV